MIAKEDGTTRFARVLSEHKQKIHRGKSADFVHGYWKAVDDIAARYGITLEPQTDFSNSMVRS